MGVLENLEIAFPELILAASGLFLLMVGVFLGKNATRIVGGLSVVALGSAFLGVALASGESVTTFGGMLVADAFVRYAKLVTLLAALLTLLLTLSWMARERVEKFEVPVLMLFAVLGMLMMISAHNLMVMYMGLELMSLASYVLAAFRRDTLRSTEAGLKYFVLGSVASGMLLYGMSMVYGFSGTITFEALSDVLARDVPTGVSIGLVFIVCGMAFKVSAAPFHMWTPDVYEGSPTPITAFFAAAPKVAAMALFIRLLAGPFAAAAEVWQGVLWLIAVVSMVIGAFGAIGQTNVKRLMAYSSISHMGYILVGLVSGTSEGVSAALIYLLLYVVMSLGAFAIILSMRNGMQSFEALDDFSGLAKVSPMLGWFLVILLFSMGGLPPLTGFFAKLSLIIAAVDAGHVILAIIMVLSSVVAAFYYIRLIKIICFDEPAETFDRPATVDGVIIWGSSVVTLLFFVWLAPLIAQADAAAKILFPG